MKLPPAACNTVESVEFFYRHYAPRMVKLCMQYTDNRHDAEDIVQEGFIKAFIHIGQYRATGSLESWIKVIIINTLMKYYTNRKLRFARHLLPIDAAANISCHGENGYERLTEKDLLHLVAKLTPGRRKVFRLKAIEGYAHREIAILLKVTESTSKSQFFWARKALLDMIAEVPRCQSKLTENAE